MRQTILALVTLLAFLFPTAAYAWHVDMEQSSITFEATQAGVPFTGTVENWTAEIKFNPDDLSKTNIKVEMDVSSISTGDATRDGAIPGAEWFGASAHPTATYTATSAREGEDGGFVLEGTLELKGVSSEVELPFTLEIEGETGTAEGSTEIMRTTFNVGEGEFESEQAAGHAVTVMIKVVASKGD